MKRFAIACAIFLSMLIFSGFTLNDLYHTKIELLDKLDQIQSEAESGNYEKAAALSHDFNEYWDEEEKILIRYIRHTPLDAITSISARMESLARYEDVGQLLAHVEELRVNVLHLWDSEVPFIRNLL